MIVYIADTAFCIYIDNNLAFMNNFSPPFFFFHHILVASYFALMYSQFNTETSLN